LNVEPPGKRSATLAFFCILALLVWSVVLFGLFSWNVHSEKRQTRENATHAARAFFQEIVTTRYWNALHGGVYVPITEKTEPNPYLDIPNRDVTTTDGLRLTKINPAYMTRQIGEIASERNIVGFHITSANPIRPANTPSAWEGTALAAFLEEKPEYTEFVESDDGGMDFRYMAPLWVEPPCLKCHAKQGYKEGDLRGGISVTIQADPMIASRRQLVRGLAIAYVIIWAMGSGGILLGCIRLRKEETRREDLILKLKDALTQVKTLGGLLPICSSCKKVRDDEGYWHQVEAYITERSDAEFSHGICPDCVRELYPEFDPDSEKKA
jgi:hypothetical protein